MKFKKNKNKLIIFGCITSLSFVTSLSINSIISNQKNNNIQIEKEKYKNIQQKPNNLEELRKKSVDDIIQLKCLDMRNYNLVTSVKNQGAEGICWAYAMAAASEVNMLYKQDVVDKKYNGTNFGLSAKNIDRIVNIRNGNYDKLNLTNDDIIKRSLGNATVKMFNSAQLLAQQNGPIIGNPDANKEPGNNAAWLESIVSIPNNEKDIKKAIAKYGAVSFAYRHSGETWYYATKKDITHAATIIGWDDNYSKDLFKPTKPKRNGAWIVKNSWGSESYDNGYFYLAYDSFIDDIIAFDYSNKNKFQNIYYYDGLGRIGESLEIQNKKVAAIFPVKKASYNRIEKLKGITFGLTGENAKVKATIYKNVNANPIDRFSSFNNPESGEKVLEQESDVFENKVHYGGLYTMTLNKEIELVPGSYFSIVLEPMNDSNSAKILFSSEPNSYNDLTFFKNDNGEWSNAWIDSWGTQSCNVAIIKALTIEQDNNKGSKENKLIYSNVTLSDEPLIYTKENFKPQIKEVKFDNKELIEGVDYEVIYEKLIENENNIKYHESKPIVGTLKIIIKGINKFNGEKILFRPIEKSKEILTEKLLIENIFSDKNSFENNQINLNLVDKFDRQFNKYSDIEISKNFKFIHPSKTIEYGKNAITQIKYIGDDEFCFEKTTINVFVEKSKHVININETTSNDINEFTYTGNKIFPSIELTFNNTPLYFKKDYILNYKNNVNVGIGEIEVIGNNWFNNTKIINFKIVKATNKIIKWELDKNNEIIFDSLFGKESVIYEYYNDEYGKEKLENKPYKAGTYYVKAIIPETNNYERIDSSLLKLIIQQLNNDENNNENIDNNQSNSNNKKNVMLISIFATFGGITILMILILIFVKLRIK